MKTALEVKDLLGDYRPANPDEILSAAKEVISHRYRRGAYMSSPQAHPITHMLHCNTIID